MAKTTKKTSNNAFLPIVLIVLAVGGAGIYYALQNKPKPIGLAPGTALPTAEGRLRGDPNAPSTIMEFADFECPHCSLVAKILPEVLKAYPKDATLYYKFFPLPSHTFAEQAARAAWAIKAATSSIKTV